MSGPTDFHHIIRRLLTGDHDGVFQDFDGTRDELVRSIERGWLKTGEWSNYRQKHRGTDPAGIPRERFVFCLQNHDRVGNRGKGDRLHHAVDTATYRAATAALLLAPETPMLFQGQEWAASTPFFYFTDHAPELGQAIRDGRAREFALYDDFNTPAKLAAIPDPQAEATFRRSVLDWAERNREPHAATLRWYKALLQFRQAESVSHSRTGGLIGEGWHGFKFSIGSCQAYVVLRGEGAFTLAVDESRRPSIRLSSEASEFATDPEPITIEPPLPTESGIFRIWTIRFRRPGAVILDFEPVAQSDAPIP